MGPYEGIGLSGKAILRDDGVIGPRSMELGSDESGNDIKRLDYGLQVGAGIEKSAIQISVFYKFGLADITNWSWSSPAMANPDDKEFHRVMGLSVGYKLGAKESAN